jgi:hypothetical protein
LLPKNLPRLKQAILKIAEQKSKNYYTARLLFCFAPTSGNIAHADIVY